MEFLRRTRCQYQPPAPRAHATSIADHAIGCGRPIPGSAPASSRTLPRGLWGQCTEDVRKVPLLASPSKSLRGSGYTWYTQARTPPLCPREGETVGAIPFGGPGGTPADPCGASGGAPRSSPVQVCRSVTARQPPALAPAPPACDSHQRLPGSGHQGATHLCRGGGGSGCARGYFPGECSWSWGRAFERWVVLVWGGGGGSGAPSATRQTCQGHLPAQT